MNARMMAAAGLVAILLAAGGGMAVEVETVPVGNLGNTSELSGAGAGGFGPDANVGAVDYVYNIGKYEVTAGQYTEFLNAVAATDTYGLYNAGMDTSSFGCQITQNGNDGNYTYDFSGRPSGTEADWANRPVNFVSWGDAARFANWLHNGQPTDPQGLSTTEDGAYFLNGATDDANLLAATREADWKWAITTEDEWYKAAYHKNDGDSNNYFDYPTRSDTAPTAETPPGGSNSANYDWAVGNLTDVGAYTSSDSPYGTFDQGGNVWEWNEAILSGLYRGLRGGVFLSSDNHLHASHRNDSNPVFESINIGFRVSAVPEPASASLLLLGAVALLRRRKK